MEAFPKLTNIVTRSPILKFFDPKLLTRASSDDSKSSLRAVPEQLHSKKNGI